MKRYNNNETETETETENTDGTEQNNNYIRMQVQHNIEQLSLEIFQLLKILCVSAKYFCYAFISHRNISLTFACSRNLSMLA